MSILNTYSPKITHTQIQKHTSAILLSEPLNTLGIFAMPNVTMGKRGFPVYSFTVRGICRQRERETEKERKREAEKKR